MKRPRKRVEQSGYVEGPKDGSYFLRYWTEPDGDGKRHRKAVEIGIKGQFASKTEANLSVEAATLRRRLNAGIYGKTMGQVIDQFEQDNLPGRLNTRATALVLLQHCRDRWDTESVSEMADPRFSKRIEGWLDGLHFLHPCKNETKPRPLAYLTKCNVHKQMSLLFNLAMRQGYIPSTMNPMDFVRVHKTGIPLRRQTLKSDILDHFFGDPDIPAHVKVIAHVARLTGLRISEILGLKKDDLNLDTGTLQVSRRIYRRNVDAPKSVKSGEPIPFPDELIDILNQWFKSSSYYPNFEGWIFASPRTGSPYSASSMQENYIRPFGRVNNIRKFGWHTFRHSYKQFLEDNGVSPEVVQRLMRHSDYRTTAGYGSGLVMDRLRSGQVVAVDAMHQPAVVSPRKRWA